MTDYTLTEHNDGTVEVEVLTAAAGEAVRVALLDAAPSPRAVRTVTHRARPGFRVARELAVAAGLLPADDEAPAPKKAPAKKAAPKKTATETTDAGDSNGE